LLSCERIDWSIVTADGQPTTLAAARETLRNAAPSCCAQARRATPARAVLQDWPPGAAPAKVSRRMVHDPLKPPPGSETTLRGSDKKAAPASRFGRLARLGALVPRALPVAMEGARRALGVSRTEEQERAAREKAYEDAKKAGKALLKTLGEMKGLPLKLGQMFSYIDGLAPPGYEDKVQRLLRQLQEKAPPLCPEAAEKVVLQEFGMSPQHLYIDWERQPFAAASLGQVHRAVTRGGDRVAVKVQYPGIDKALQNDLKSLSMLEMIIAPLSRQYQSKETLEEIKKVFLDELDYGIEAENADLFRRITSDLPDVYIPQVHHALSSRRVLTTEYIEGRSYEQFCREACQRDRDAAGVTIWTFMFRSLLRYGVMYADPHPGNYRFLGGGRVAFLDFGCVKILPPNMVAGIKRYIRAAMDADWAEFDRACVEFLGYDPTDPKAWDLYRSYTLELLMPVTTNRPYQATPEGAREAVQFLVRGHRKLMKEADGGPRLPPPLKMPYDLTFVNRLQWGLASIMGGLRTEAKFRELAEPWVRDGLWPLAR
jgi:predicted unusual protein kinase regulating ubiquinone biosynthesis (AarF/ABC1/UbiB family)